MFPDDYAAAFDWFCHWVFNCAQHPARPEALYAGGLEYGVQLVSATQEPHRVNSSIVGQSGELVCFRLQEPKGWDCIAELGADVETVKALPPGSFVSYHRLSGGTLTRRVF